MSIQDAINKIKYYNDLEEMNEGLEGKCDFCGSEKSEKKGRQRNFIRIFNKADSFRGNDEYLGVACFDCQKKLHTGLKVN